MMRPFIAILCSLLFAGVQIATSQQREVVLLQLQPYFQHEPLSLNTEYRSGETTVNIETFRFYLSNISLLKQGSKVWSEEYSYHLVDASDNASLIIALKVPPSIDFDRIQFNLGIDSLTNVSGAMGGDLDPTKGMYWAWQSGYINFKLEGSSPVCPTRNHLFQLHLGGYLPPYASVQPVSLKVVNDGVLNMKVDVAAFLEKIDISETHKIMSPGKEAQRLSRLASAIFSNNETLMYYRKQKRTNISMRVPCGH